MKNKYKNLWYKKLNVSKPEYYENNAEKVGQYRDVEIFKLFDKFYDCVFSGACIAQLAGWGESSKKYIDKILDGARPVSDEVAAHLSDCGFKSLTYERYVTEVKLGFREHDLF